MAKQFKIAGTIAGTTPMKGGKKCRLTPPANLPTTEKLFYCLSGEPLKPFDQATEIDVPQEGATFNYLHMLQPAAPQADANQQKFVLPLEQLDGQQAESQLEVEFLSQAATAAGTTDSQQLLDLEDTHIPEGFLLGLDDQQAFGQAGTQAKAVKLRFQRNKKSTSSQRFKLQVLDADGAIKGIVDETDNPELVLPLEQASLRLVSFVEARDLSTAPSTSTTEDSTQSRNFTRGSLSSTPDSFSMNLSSTTPTNSTTAPAEERKIVMEEV